MEAQKFMRINRLLASYRLLLVALAVLLAVMPLAACDSGDETEIILADYGSYGADFALKLATEYPNRSPGSDQELAAGDLIIKEFKSLGYTPIVTTFTFADDQGNSLTSRNIAVLIEGSGFSREQPSGQIDSLNSQVIVGAHYDTTVTAEQAAAAQPTTEETTTSPAGETSETSVPVPTLADCDGIHDNASGIGSLLTIAREIKKYQYGYDVILVAFGAGAADQAGSRWFASQLGTADLSKTSVMYCIDSIYAGDKVYAHAGRRSALGGTRKDYEKRRKLYEVTDVFYENELYTNNAYMLYTNQSSVMLELEGFPEKVVYREWSLNDSDYLPFDDLGVPVVFFESFDYNEDSLEDMKESQNPAFGETGGLIRGTHFDASEFLHQLLNTTLTTETGEDVEVQKPVDKLVKRINNTSFIILEAINKGIHDAEKR